MPTLLVYKIIHYNPNLWIQTHTFLMPASFWVTPKSYLSSIYTHLQISIMTYGYLLFCQASFLSSSSGLPPVPPELSTVISIYLIQFFLSFLFFLSFEVVKQQTSGLHLSTLFPISEESSKTCGPWRHSGKGKEQSNWDVAS